MRIGQTKPSNKRRLKPPPDYSSRRMQWRLLAAVAGLMLVLTVAFEARNPQRWKWLTELDQLAKPQEQINPRLVEPSTREASDEVVVGQRTRPKLPSPLSEDQALTADDRAWASGWEDVFGRLSILERKSLYELLKAARDQESIPQPERAAADDVIGQLDRYWAEYRATARSGLEDLSEAEQAAWLPVLEQLELRWTTEIKPLLMILAQGEALAEDQGTRLMAVQDLLDRL